MTFKEYKETIIEDFVEDCRSCNTLLELTESELKHINEQLNEHANCFDDGFEDAKAQGMELISSCVYGDKISASIECVECNTIIIDDESILEGRRC